ncbi:hypothetical protein KLP40_14645 [Hymenobacter sp. NST-14]|uniref:hypothetical protein n=1 Tax=Hymenobacter piscis TaxID=2839984 RepID=UPI001C0329DE|nr:hypothetical protein [Hymenobacter piscis]MBT9394407.1 hypothetical protein [Hymenobacter piscis]
MKKNPYQLRLKVGEFQQFIGEEAYNPVLERVFHHLNDSAIHAVSLYPGLTVSKHSHARPATSPGTDVFDICIRTNEPEGRRKVLLYDLFHEWGHFLDEQRLPQGQEHDPCLQLGREERAWEFADKEFARHPELAADRPAYEAYQQQCLASYRQRCQLSPIS